MTEETLTAAKSSSVPTQETNKDKDNISAKSDEDEDNTSTISKDVIIKATWVKETVKDKVEIITDKITVPQVTIILFKKDWLKLVLLDLILSSHMFL